MMPLTVARTGELEMGPDDEGGLFCFFRRSLLTYPRFRFILDFTLFYEL